MVKEITAELTDEQFEKYEIMKNNDMSVGDAIDLIFKLRDDLHVQNDVLLEERVAELTARKESLADEMAKLDDELSVLDKLKDSALDVDQKAEILEKEYAPVDGAYDRKVQDYKRTISWAKDFFKF